MNSGEEGKASLLEELDILLPHQGIILFLFLYFLFTLLTVQEYLFWSSLWRKKSLMWQLHLF
jgi:hypothetical protein